jgi:hypothetical protein
MMAENRAATIAHRLETDEEETETFLDRQREKHPWLDHLVRAGERYTENHGDHYAAAITYFSILALVPLLMVGFAAAGVRAARQPGASRLPCARRSSRPRRARSASCSAGSCRPRSTGPGRSV